MDYSLYKQQKLSGRYITTKHTAPLIFKLSEKFDFSEIGSSVKGTPIYKLKFGSGKKKVLIWSQMHGNESTTTKAVFDLLNFLNGSDELAEKIAYKCEIHIIPMLNPDGSEAYTRVNHNNIDLNRDAQQLSQPESRVLRHVFETLQPDFCFNLHDQRTIFNVKGTAKPATVSFLAPSADAEKKLTPARIKAMSLVAAMNDRLQTIIPGQIGRYDDGFNLNCVGDTFQSMLVPTILFEAGHYPGDYQREKTRELIWEALIEALKQIANDNLVKDRSADYFAIPENDKLFFDIIIYDVPVSENGKTDRRDIAVQYKEVLKNNSVVFIPEINGIGSYKNHLSHKKMDYIDYQKDAIYLNDLDNFWISEFLKDFY